MKKVFYGLILCKQYKISNINYFYLVIWQCSNEINRMHIPSIIEYRSILDLSIYIVSILNASMN